jgi:hypothetical protein
MNAALDQLRAEGHAVLDDDIARLSPFVRHHLNVHGHYSFLRGRAAAQPTRRRRSSLHAKRHIGHTAFRSLSALVLSRPKRLFEPLTFRSAGWYVRSAVLTSLTARSAGLATKRRGFLLTVSIRSRV